MGVGVTRHIDIFLALLYVMFSCVFVTFPCGILGQVWYLIISNPDLCLLPYFYYAPNEYPQQTSMWRNLHAYFQTIPYIFFRFSSPPASMKYKQIKNGVEGFSEKPSTPFFYLPIKEKMYGKG